MRIPLYTGCEEFTFNGSQLIAAIVYLYAHGTTSGIVHCIQGTQTIELLLVLSAKLHNYQLLANIILLFHQKSAMKFDLLVLLDLLD